MRVNTVRYKIEKGSGHSDLYGQAFINRVDKDIQLYFNTYDIKFIPYPKSDLGLGAGADKLGLIMSLITKLWTLIIKFFYNLVTKVARTFNPSVHIDLGSLVDDSLVTHDSSIHPGYELAKLIALGKNLNEYLRQKYPTLCISLTARVRYPKYQYNAVCYIPPVINAGKTYDYFIHFIRGLAIKGNAYERFNFDSRLIRHERFLFNKDNRVSDYKLYKYLKIDKVLNGPKRTRCIQVNNTNATNQMYAAERHKKSIDKFIGLSGLFDTYINI